MGIDWAKFSWENTAVRLTVLGIVLLELLSFFGWAVPAFGNVVFVSLLIAVFLASLKDLRIGVALMAAELMIGSHGYLFAFIQGGLSVSLRIGLFLVVCSVALGKAIAQRDLRVWQSAYRTPLLVLAAAIIYAVARGVYNGNGFANVFFDTNAFLFFGAVLPLWQAVKNREDLLFILHIAFAAACASVLKVLVLVYMFSHKLWWALPETYRWVRDTRIGELTQVTDTVFRIFFQSQILTVIVYFVLLALAANGMARSGKSSRALFYLLTAFIASILISLSRSNWMGMVAALVAMPMMYWRLHMPVLRPMLRTGAYGFLSMVGGIVLLAAVMLVPFPPANGSFSASLFGSRALTFTEEAGVGSRWALHGPLWAEIMKHPILGQGFGKEVTYKTQDPRLLAQNPTGEYTTFIFEWGYHDLWLKLGVFGLLAYGYLLITLARQAGAALKVLASEPDYRALMLGLTFGLVSVLVTHTTSPYINHPLGISFLLFYGLIAETLAKTRAKEDSA